MSDAPRNPPIAGPPIRLAVCVSGEGTTLQNLIDQIRSRRLKAEVVQVVASRPRIGAIARAEAAGIPPRWPANKRLGRKPSLALLCLRTHPPQQGGPGHLRRLPRSRQNPYRL